MAWLRRVEYNLRPKRETMARQYFNSQSVDSSIVAVSVNPTTTKTFLFTNSANGQGKAMQFFPLPYGSAAPFAGQVFRFSMGGILTTASTGTLIIDPFHGPGTAQSAAAGGTDMGASGAQTTTASLSNAPWRMEGEL